MTKREFLTFDSARLCQPVKVSTDSSGDFKFLADISFRDFATTIDRHILICDSEVSEDEKLLALSELWRDISPEIGGYLFGDICYDPDSSTCFKR